MIDMRWYKQDKAKVAAGLKAGERPDLATTTALGPLDELVVLHQELGVFAALEGLENGRQREGIADELLMRTLAVLPFVGNVGFRSQADLLFREPAILLRLGWTPVQIRSGDNERYRHPQGRQAESLPCHPDTLRDALARIAQSAWQRAQSESVQELFRRNLVRGKVYAVDGTGLGTQGRVVALVCVSGSRPVVVAWRYLEGAASEKGREASVTKQLVEQVVAAGGKGCFDLLLADALYADGPLLAWLKYAQGIDALVRLPEDRLLYEDLQGLAEGGYLEWSEYRYLRTLQGHKEIHKVALAGAGSLDSWDSFREAAAGYGVGEAKLWACLIRKLEPQPAAGQETWALVSTREWGNARAAFQAYRSRWVVEDDTFRELKEGWGLEKQPWGRQSEVVRGRVTLTLLAFNTAQIYRSQSGERLLQKGIRRLRQEHRRELGAAPAVIYLGGYYGVFAFEEVLAILGAKVKESLLPQLPRQQGRIPSSA